MHACIYYTLTRSHAHIHTWTHTYTHAHTHTYTYIHIHTHTYTYTHIHTYTYTYTYTYTHSLVCACVHYSVRPLRQLLPQHHTVHVHSEAVRSEECEHTATLTHCATIFATATATTTLTHCVTSGGEALVQLDECCLGEGRRVSE